MTWYLLKDAAELLHVSERSVWRKIRTKELHASKNDEGKVIVNIDDTGMATPRVNEVTSQAATASVPTRISLPDIPQSKLTADVNNKIDVLLESIRTTEGITAVESRIEIEHGIPRGTLARWKAQLRKLYELPTRAPLHTLATHPQVRQHGVETALGRWRHVLKYLPGYKGSNYGKKPDELPKQVKAGVLLTEEEYRKLFQEAVNTINNRPRRDLGGISPLQFYLANQSQMKFVDERSLNFLQMKWNGGRGEGVKIHRGFVRMLGCEYFSMDLDAFNGQRAQLYYDPSNIGRVAVYVRGEFVTFAVDKELLGVSEKDWLVIVKERARRNREIAEEIRSIRKGMTFEEAKAILFNAEINNVSTVDPALLQRRTPVVVHLTGIESKAAEFHEKLDEQIKREEAEEKRKKKSTPLSLINVNNIR